MNETPASDQEIEDAISQFHEERAALGDKLAMTLSSVAVNEGIAKVVYDPAKDDSTAAAWLSRNPHQNLADYACLPLALASPESTRMRMSTVRVETYLEDGTPLGALENSGIRALNSLDI